MSNNIGDIAKANVFSSPFVASSSNEKSLVTAPRRQLGFAASDSGSLGGSVVYGSGEYYAKCAFGGLLSCGITHTAVVPLDLVKCRIQVDPGKYKSIGTGFKVTVAEEGARGLTKGWFPTLIGYSIQGVGKFGFYELFKILYGNALGEVSVFCFSVFA